MAKITVTSQMQPIYPDGMQHDLIVTNEGPSTIWLGSDTSTSIAQSMPVAPLSSVHWGAGIPLYAVSDGTANARLDHNVSSPISAGEGKVVVLQSITPYVDASPHGLLIEAGSYQSISVSGRGDQATPPAANSMYVVTFRWYADREETQLIYSESVYIKTLMEPIVNYVYGYSATRSVRGRFCRITVDGITNNVAPTVLGSTIELYERSAWSDSLGNAFWTRAAGSLANGLNVNGGSRTYACVINTLDYWAPTRIYIPNEGKRLSIYVNLSAAVTTAMQLRLYADYNGLNVPVAGPLNFAVGSGDGEWLNRPVPMSSQLYLQFNTQFSAAGGINLILVWTDE